MLVKVHRNQIYHLLTDRLMCWDGNGFAAELYLCVLFAFSPRLTHTLRTMVPGCPCWWIARREVHSE